MYWWMTENPEILIVDWNPTDSTNFDVGIYKHVDSDHEEMALENKLLSTVINLILITPVQFE